MKSALRETRAWRLVAALWGRLPAMVRESRLLSGAFVLVLLNAVFWLLVVSDRYVAEAHVVVDRTDVGGGQVVDFSSLVGNSTSNRDLMLMRDFLLSSDMIERLDKRLHLREHYSDWRRDPFTRLWFAAGPREWFYDHVRARVEAESDERSDVLRIRVQAYTPEMSQAIARELVHEGEAFMNEVAHGLAREQVAFLEEEVARMGARLQDARNKVLKYQDTQGYVSPERTVEGLSSIQNQLESDLARLRAQRGALLGYLSKDAPDVVRVNLQIAGLEEQLAREKRRLTAPHGKALNTVAEEFQRLQIEAQFAEDVYKSSLVALEKGRVDATRTMKKVSVVQAPQLPDLAMEPRRLYNVVLYTLLILIVTGIFRLLGVIVGDHKD